MSVLALSRGEKTGEPSRYKREMVVDADFSPSCGIAGPLNMLGAIRYVAIAPAESPTTILRSFNK